jgi:hypothetical protein
MEKKKITLKQNLYLLCLHIHKNIKMADPDYYPSIRETFHILLTMPMGSVKKHMNTLIFCFEASKAMEQNNNGRGQVMDFLLKSCALW